MSTNKCWRIHPLAVLIQSSGGDEPLFPFLPRCQRCTNASVHEEDKRCPYLLVVEAGEMVLDLPGSPGMQEISGRAF